ncbi:phosphoribosylformylglycinamidine synthase subunit PurS [soil metagenome]|nr:phosphoribosylformylglycinamidine synthase subunit PurS [Chloroflexia bacterium]
MGKQQYLVEVFISLKEVVNDPQGLAIRDGLHNLGFDEVDGVRAGKYLQVSVNAGSPEQAQQRTAEMCDTLLANTVIEEYRITVADRATS